MLERKVMKELEAWKRQTGKKTCLLLYGVRQCGKTFIIREFGRKYYRNVVELNFIQTPALKEIFQGSLQVDHLLQVLSLYFPDAKIEPGDTLLFFDELQECPEARTSLKFWAEDGRYDVIASGSLLGLHVKNTVSIPVGYETPLEMFPLDFEEFLWSLGISSETIRMLEKYMNGEPKIPDAIHDKMMEYLRQYIVVGGMPDVVNEFLGSGNYQQVHRVQERILSDYQDDIAKYASGADRVKARNCYLSIPRQLAKENHKFQYSVVEKKATARKFENSLDWLSNAGMIRYCYNVSLPAFPLMAYVKEDQFRVYLSDIGLFVCFYGYQVKATILSDKLEGPAKGGIYESLIADILYKQRIPLYYYKKEDSTLEIEFLLEKDGKPVPVEVKAKKGPTKSLNEVLKKPEVAVGYKLSSQNSGVDDKKITLPLYMALFFGKMEEVEKEQGGNDL